MALDLNPFGLSRISFACVTFHLSRYESHRDSQDMQDMCRKLLGIGHSQLGDLIDLKQSWPGEHVSGNVAANRVEKLEKLLAAEEKPFASRKPTTSDT